ncbi:hypothetical protein ACFQE0_25035 [Methylobacterium komagatae]|uniref:Uncharacterized protein n=1 Tax=Methylobacterium komagatae TaxID=374425 RepID=A0ABW2BT77_9HYPH
MNRHRKIERSSTPDTVQTPSEGVVIPFPGLTQRPARPAPDSSEARGQILLFLGVRYERRAS